MKINGLVEQFLNETRKISEIRNVDCRLQSQSRVIRVLSKDLLHSDGLEKALSAITPSVNTVQVPPEKPNCLPTSVPLTVLFSRLYYRVCSLLCALERFIFQTRNKETCSRTNLESEVISTETISTDRTFMWIYKMLLEENPTVIKQLLYNTFLHTILNMLIILIPY